MRLIAQADNEADIDFFADLEHEHFRALDIVVGQFDAEVGLDGEQVAGHMTSRRRQ